MAIEVRNPTILRQYTGGQKAVQASGSPLGLLAGGDEVTILPAVAGG